MSENTIRYPEIVVRTFTKQIGIEKIFKNDYPVWIEIGFGVGKFFLSLAKTYPEINLIGIEHNLSRYHRMKKKITKLGLKNTYIISTDASMAIKYLFSPESIDRLFVNFPDPWQKGKHEKNRLLTTEFILSAHTILKNNSVLRIVTDVQKYAQKVKETLDKSYIFSGVKTNDIDLPTTTFQDRFIAQNLPIYEMIYKKIGV